jgi:UDP-N-acetylmuramoyl-L-alanyl-D-glutamate--2,6-diaminopimelate ligase
MRLAELFPQVDGASPDCEVTGISADSRDILPGFVFFAIPGTKADGFFYADEAIKRGAIAIVAEREPEIPFETAVFIIVSDVRRALSVASAQIFPGQPETIVAITGTSGKTSVAAFVRQIWVELGHAAASLGTIGVVAPSGAIYGSLTTPDPVNLHKTLDGLAGQGVTHLAVEASSHGIAQRRLDGVRLTAAAFTNLSRDHLDYHADLDDYLSAKLRLFDTLLPRGRFVVVDADSDVSAKVAEICKIHNHSILSVGSRGEALQLLSAEPDDFATRLQIRYENKTHSLRLPLAGDFQVANALVAAGLCLATGGAAEAVFAALERLEGAPGRLELVARHKGASIFIDYAHKPDALDKVLRTLRPSTLRRLIVVFGCGGDRDTGKRPIMGELAARLADLVIVTDDNPRSEEPASIRKAILAGAYCAGGPHPVEIDDRAKAIAEAVAGLKAGDVLLIAGKGHETGQIVGNSTLPFSDHETVRAALKDCAA